jgi:hypothetical protein
MENIDGGVRPVDCIVFDHVFRLVITSDVRERILYV